MRNTNQSCTAGRWRVGLMIVAAAALTTAAAFAQDPIWFQGLEASPVGQAELSLQNGELIATNLRNGGVDGISLALNRSGGLALKGHPFWDPANNPADGTYMQSISYHNDNGVTTTSKSETVDGRVRFSADFSGVGATEKIVEVVRNGVVVASQQHSGEVDASAPAFWRCYYCICTGGDGRDGTAVYIYGVGPCPPIRTLAAVETLNFTMPNGDVVVGDYVQIRSADATVEIEYTSRVDYVVNGMPEMKLEWAAPAIHGNFHHAEGDARLSPNHPTFDISNLGNTGSDGVVAILEDAHGVDFDLDPVQLPTAGASMTITAAGTFNGQAESDLGSARIQRDAANQLAVSTNFAAVGATNVRVEVHDAGGLVGTAVVPNGVVGHVTNAALRITGCGKLNPIPPQLPCFWLDLEAPFTFNASNGSVLVGTQIRLLADNATGTVDGLGEFGVYTSGVSAFTITEEVNDPIMEPPSGVDREIVGSAARAVYDRAADAVAIELPAGIAGAVRIGLFDASGRLVGSAEREIAGGRRTELPAAGLPSGVYHVRLKAGAFACATSFVIAR